MADDRVQLIIEGIDRATQVFNGITKQLKALRNEADKAGTGVGESFARSKSHLNAVENQFGRIKTQIMGVVAAWKLFDIARDAIMLTSRVETLSAVLGVMGRNVQLSKAEVAAYVGQVKAMGITTEASQQSIIRMVQAQLDLSKAGQLARVAQDAAVIGNVNSSQALEQMIHAIVTLQPEVLRTIGITVNFEQEYKKAADTVGKSADQLTQAEKQQIAMNAVLEQGTKIQGAYEAAMGTAGKQLKSMERYTEELRLKLGEIGSGAFTTVIFEVVDGLKEWDKSLSALKESGDLSQMSDDLQYGVLVALNDIKTLAVDIWNVLKEFGPVVKLFLELIVMAANGWGDILAAIRPVTEIMGKLIGMGWDFVQVLKSAANVLTSIATGDFQGLKQALREIGSAAGDLAKKTSEGSAMLLRFPESVADSLLARDAAKQAARNKVAEARAKKEYENAQHIPSGLGKPTYGSGETSTKKGGGKGGENALESWASKLRDLDTDIRKALFPDDDLSRKLEDIRNKYEDLIAQAGKYAKEHGKGFDTAKVEEWRKTMEQAARSADAEKKLKAWTDVEQQVTERTAPELERRLAAEDKFMRESEEKLKKAGFSHEEISEKMVQVTAAAAEKKKKIELDYINTVMEAESRRYLSQLDMMEKERSGSKLDITRQRISVYQSILSAYQQNWENETDPTAKILWADKIDETRSKLIDLNITLKEQDGLFTEGLGKGLRDYLWDMKSVFQQGVEMARESAQAMESAFSDFFFDAFQGKLQSLADYLNSFLKSVHRALANALGQQVSTGLTSLVQGIFSSGTLSSTVTGSVGIPSSANYVPGVHHSGGEVRKFIPTFHAGGLNDDERLVINRVGERYITREQNEWLTRMAKTTEGTQPKVSLIVNNNTGQPVKARQETTQVNPQETIVTLWLDAYNRNAYGLKSGLGG
ncbi:MAG: hypothetical protein GXX82_16550 [Syntrophorhabdus sp.]|nr:hypothetical protein [Syntrophorhabdus sp.]